MTVRIAGGNNVFTKNLGNGKILQEIYNYSKNKITSYTMDTQGKVLKKEIFELSDFGGRQKMEAKDVFELKDGKLVQTRKGGKPVIHEGDIFQKNTK